MDFSSRYQTLNAAQRQAVDTIDGPLIVLAGPGTGKTELLSIRTANILRLTDTLAENILCLTFTESGADAMRDRLTSIIGPDAYKVAIHTFHSFGADIISHNPSFFYGGARFQPADELSSYEIIRGIFDELDHASLLATMNSGEYTYLRDAQKVISELKQNSIDNTELLSVLDANDETIQKANQLLLPIFATKPSRQTAHLLLGVLEPLRNSTASVPVPAIQPLAGPLTGSLEAAVNSALERQSTAPVTAWRNSWMQKNSSGDFELKSRQRQEKLRALSHVYYQYLVRMEEAKLFDFDDMIMRVIHAMESQPELLLNLQERYQYIMVDEFQDTNLAQMRILQNLVTNDVWAGRPNIMVVGDDDQGIYSFQGANVGNINYFLDLFPAAPRIPLTDNYRSVPEVLTAATEVITQLDDRLSIRLNDINKTLVPHRQSKGGTVELCELPTRSRERHWVLKDIMRQLEAGTNPGDIAVLARNHKELMEILPYFTQAGIPVSYERRDNVLEIDVIRLIERISLVLVALFEQRLEDAEALLPELLAHPAFQFSPSSLWQLSVSAYRQHQTWLETMASLPEFKNVHEWMIAQAYAVASTPLERMLDVVIGVQQPDDTGFTSPLYAYYFDSSKVQSSAGDYLVCLDALRTIRTKLREYRPDTTATLAAFTDFIQLHRQTHTTITAVRESSPGEHAVRLMTAHKSKGLEFETVYILNATDTTWGERVRTRSRQLAYPENLQLNLPDSPAERIRLFFVAMTRAKERLVITYARADDAGKPLLLAQFLLGSSLQPRAIDEPQTPDQQLEAAKMDWYGPLVTPIQADMREVLRPMLAAYKLSSTHLTRFLDVSRGGPQAFLMENLLHFPSSPAPAASYGTAVHTALQRAHTHLLATGSQRPLEDILRDYEDTLREMRLTDADFRFYLQKGSDVLTNFLKARPDNFTPRQKAEVSFSHQGVTVGQARLTGSVDMIEINDSVVSVTDYKTGKPVASWKGSTDSEKIKLHRFKQQLMFYELLLSRSREYGKYTVHRRVLQFVEPDATGDIISLEASYTPDDCARFERLIQAVWQRIVTLDLPDSSEFEPTYKGVLTFEAYLLEEK